MIYLYCKAKNIAMTAVTTADATPKAKMILLPSTFMIDIDWKSN
jgi:hypothetical protein